MSDLWVVTGAASGIGLAVCQRVVAGGGQVLALDIQEVPVTGVQFEHCDVSRSEDWDRVASLVQSLGKVTHLHLNAGIQIAPPDAPLSDYRFDAMTEARYRRMMGVNVDGVVFGLHRLLPHLDAGSAVVVTASLAGITPYPTDVLYTASKHAVVGLVRSMGPVLKEQDIRINALCPGGIDTAIIPHDQRDSMPAAALMSPEDIADEVLRLMDESHTGLTWAKVAAHKPAFIVRAPGDKGDTAKA